MTSFLSYRRSLLLAGVIGLLTAAPAMAQQPAPSPPPTPPGFSPIDKTKPAESKQDTSLRPHPTPPTATALEKIPVDKIKLPAGFKAEVWSHGHPGARTMVMGDKGTMFMGTRLIGRVYAITNKDGKREVKTLLTGLDPAERARLQGRRALRVRHQQGVPLRQHRGQARQSRPAGRADRQVRSPGHHPSQLEIRRVRARRQALRAGRRQLQHLRDQHGIHGQIRRYNADGSGMEIVARGVRNTVGFDWHPTTQELWFTDNGRDWAGNDGPEDELNRIARGQEGAFYGFPYCHANGVPDPDIKNPEPVRRRHPARGPDRTACRRARHQVLHRHDVPCRRTRTLPSSPAAARGTGRRSSATT